MPVTDTTQIDTYYQALLDRRESFVGVFFVGVKTTSVFCIATCRARKPKRENVEFFSTVKEALDYGYRPCKVCKPTQHASEAPEQVQRAIQLVKDGPRIKITDAQLRKQNISPEVLRRWFNKNYGMTFQAYQRMYRINCAFEELKHGKNTTHTAYDSGYESLSGFAYTFKKLIGKSPQRSAGQHVISMSRMTTPLGPMFICATARGLCLLEFTDRRMLETELRELQTMLQAPIIVGENEHIKQARAELEQYFAGKRSRFELSLHTPGTEFQQTVWAALQEIPPGETRSYQQQADRLGKPTTVRAVARANGANRLAIVIPCHRVLGADGSLTGYGGGLERKQWLLNHEQRMLHSALP